MICWTNEFSKIKDMLMKGKTIIEVAKIYNVSFQAISYGMERGGLSVRDINSQRMAIKRAKRAERELIADAKKEIRKRESFYKKYSDISSFKPSRTNYNCNKVLSNDPKDIANRERQAAYRDDNYIKVLARRIVAYAIKRGYIIHQPCSMCGRLDTIEYHHNDYNKALDIVCLCKECHVGVHSGEQWHIDRKI